jgi:hypothetical protein
VATTKTVTLDRELVERFIIEVDALATFDMIRSGGDETPLSEHIYRIMEPFERAALGRMSEEKSNAFHDRGIERGHDVAREMFGHLFAREEVARAR